MHRLQELVRLHRMGTKVRETARLLGLSPNTERRYRLAFQASELLEGPVDTLPSLEVLQNALRKEQPIPATPSHERSTIETWAPRVEELVDKGLMPRAIYDRLRQEEVAFSGSYWSVRRLYRQIQQRKGVCAEDVAIPVDTASGDVAQVDFGAVGKLICPERHTPRSAWVFVMTLGYSRHMFAKVVFDQKVDTWLQLHIDAFNFFGGVPRTMVPDNLKAAVIRAAFGAESDAALNRSYRELARHYGFKIDPAPPRSPKKKGKVESAVKYVKRNALAGRENEDIQDVNRSLSRWVVDVAGTRTHGSTGKRPLTVFMEEEQLELRSLPKESYQKVVWAQAKVHQDAHIAFEKRLYSVPWKWIGRRVWVRATPSAVFISQDILHSAESGEVPVMHLRTGENKRSTLEEHLPEGRRDRRHRSQSFWQERAKQVDPKTDCLIQEVFESDDVLSQLRTVQAIVTYLEQFPQERAEAAARRASFFGIFTYRGMKSILTKALDREPLPTPILPRTASQPPRFARNLDEVVRSKLEAEHESN